MTRTCTLALAAATLFALGGSSFAGQLVYQPTNPTFGGNPLNGSFLLSTAQTQGAGVKSGQQQVPDLSGLNDALSNLGNIGDGTGGGSPIIIIGGTGGTTTIPGNP
jgi:curli production assembly/transport component CsgF